MKSFSSILMIIGLAMISYGTYQGMELRDNLQQSVNQLVVINEEDSIYQKAQLQMIDSLREANDSLNILLRTKYSLKYDPKTQTFVPYHNPVRDSAGYLVLVK